MSRVASPMVRKVMAATGLGRNQVFRLTREGRIPATIIGEQFVMTEGQFDQLMREGVGPERSEPEAPSFIRTMKRTA